MIPLATWISEATAVSSVNSPDEIEIWSGTVTNGAAGAVEAHGAARIGLGASASSTPTIYPDTNIAPNANVDLTSGYYLQATVTSSVNGSAASQQSIVTQRLMYAEVR